MKTRVCVLAPLLFTSLIGLSSQLGGARVPPDRNGGRMNGNIGYRDEDARSGGRYRQQGCYDSQGWYRCWSAKRRGSCGNYIHKYVYCRRTCGNCRASYGQQYGTRANGRYHYGNRRLYGGWRYGGNLGQRGASAGRCTDSRGSRWCYRRAKQGHCIYSSYKNVYCRKTCKACSGGSSRVPVNGGWSRWSAWSVCRGRCGLGRKEKQRACTNPRPRNGGRNCYGSAKQSRSCDTGRKCPVNGGWTVWSAWSVCRGRCGLGKQDRHRACTNPRPVNGGRNCYGPAKQTRNCETGRSCAVDGGWTDWSVWTVCRGQCGQGYQDRHRSCTNPRPSNGGRNCVGFAKESRRCDTGRPCAVDGGWTDWSVWTVCRGRCGQGNQDRHRSCTNPRPSNGGRNCVGFDKESRSCDTGRPCAVDGGWTDWSVWTVCRGRCGQGNQDRHRSCTNPRPSNGGRNCYGYAKESRECDTGRPCSVDGGWTDWSVWTVCRGRCGQGNQDRHRSCTNPRPSNGGRNCVGFAKESRECDTGRPCALDGGWTDWTVWTVCRGRCGQGNQDRHRSCTNPRPSNGGRNCVGFDKESRRCDTGRPCDIRGYWGPWQAWGYCSKDCHQGQQIRRRQCLYPTQRGNVAKVPCEGLVTESRYCNSGVPCKIPGIWSQWNAWSKCTKSCRGGTQGRRRLCEYKAGNGPYEKLPCPGYAHETRQCNSQVECYEDPNACKPVLCKLYCQYGFEKNRYGCPICSCRQAPPGRS